MPQTITTSLCLMITTTLIHYEILRHLNTQLQRWHFPDRIKVVVAILGSFMAHVMEIALCGAKLYAVVHGLDAGDLKGSAAGPWVSFLYISAETYTPLGFGDLTPVGPVRLLVGTEALNDLLLIAWTASFTYLCMERFWQPPAGARP